VRRASVTNRRPARPEKYVAALVSSPSSALLSLATTTSQREGAAVEPGTVRRYELDWLRIYVIFGSISYHVMVGLQLYVPPLRTNILLGSVTTLLDLWGMPLLFCISGASAWFALERRTQRQYLHERVARLAFPFLVGILLVIPPEDYIGNTLNPAYHQSFPSYFFAKMRQYGTLFQGNVFNNFIIFWGHLWFIPDLLLFAVVTLPLFIWLKTWTGSWLRWQLAALCERRGALFVIGLFFPLCDVLRQVLLAPALAAYIQSVLYFLLSFIVGYIFYSDIRFQQAIRRQGWGLLLLGICAFLVDQWLHLSAVLPSSAQGVLPVLNVYVIWLWMLAILNVGMRYFATPNAALNYWKEATFPFYVLHVMAFAVVGVVVIHWNILLPLQFLLILLGAGGVLTLAYDQGIRKHNVLRLLFGMNPISQQKRQEPSYLLLWGKNVLARLGEKVTVSEET
jgi:glucan biosynthesis protein C